MMYCGFVIAGGAAPESPAAIARLGSRRIAAGTPEGVAREKRSYTGAFLKPVLARKGKGGRRAADWRRVRPEGR